MNEREIGYELIASDEYWGEPQPEPKVPIEKGIYDTLVSDRFAAYGGVAVQRLFKKAASEGHIVFPVHDGQPLPLLERGVGLMRIVQDIRVAPVSNSALATWWNGKRLDDTPEAFDVKARRMISDKLYAGSSARLTLPIEDSDQRMRIWRQVYYVTGSKSGVMLEGLHSSELSDDPNDMMMNFLTAPHVLGETYKRGLGKTAVSKIVAADILIAGGRKAKAPRKSFLVSSFSPATAAS